MTAYSRHAELPRRTAKMYSPGARFLRSTAVASVSADPVPGRRALRVKDRLAELVSELNRVQSILYTNREFDAEI